MSHALMKNEFVLYYQPYFDISAQNIVGVEALLRWQSREYGLVSPDLIIPLAEETDLIVPLTEWILRTSCKQVKMWQEEGCKALKLSVNLSARQFKNPNCIHHITQALRETEFTPECLMLEIQESLIMHDPANAMDTIKKLKAVGIGIVIDDFGTGFSSFSHLAMESVDKIKIDKTFIKQVATDAAKTSIVSAMIVMAKKLNIKVVAEGVETQEQYNVLVREGCDEAQGYFFTKPLPSELLETFLFSQFVAVQRRALDPADKPRDVDDC